MTHTISSIESTVVVGGVDTHLEFHVAAALDGYGTLLGIETFPTTPAGYRALSAWLGGFGPVTVVGVEGTGSYGAGLARHLHAAGVAVTEVNRPDRAARRRRGKTDAYDAEAAARTALAGHRADQAPAAKLNQSEIEGLRMLKNAHDQAVKQRTATLNLMHQLVLTAPDELRQELAGLTKHTLPGHCARFRVPTDPQAMGAPRMAAKATLKRLGHRVLGLVEEIEFYDTQIAVLTAALAPTMLDQPGVGPQTLAQLLITISENPDRFATEAAFAALCGTSPIPASSGKTDRHRLNRGGDRQANYALHMIALSRLRIHATTRDYIAARTPDGRSTPHLRRMLKRYIARELFPILRDDLRAHHTPTPTEETHQAA
jgi:transposase